MVTNDGEHSVSGPPEAATVVRRLTGGTAASVRLMEGTDGRWFVRKTAASEADLSVLRGQVRQMAAAVRAGAPAGLYPEVLSEHTDGFDMEYIPCPSLAGSAPLEGREARVLEHYFATQSHLPALRAGIGRVVPGHLTWHAAQRCGRWSDLSTSSVEASLARRWLETAKEVDAAIGPPRLRIAIHGDFRPENVIPLLAGSARAVRYVDVRGKDLVWSDGFPYWDPAMDICSFLMSGYIFTGHENRIRSLLPSDPQHLVASIRRIRSAVEGDPAFFRRVLFYFAIKCSGFAWHVRDRRTPARRDGADNLRRHLEALEPWRTHLVRKGEASAVAVLCNRLRYG